VDPKAPYLLAAGDKNAQTSGVTTDDQRLTAESWPIALLDRRKESIYVHHMEEFAEIGTMFCAAWRSYPLRPAPSVYQRGFTGDDASQRYLARGNHLGPP
jgi:hypothetical protein